MITPGNVQKRAQELAIPAIEVMSSVDDIKRFQSGMLWKDMQVALRQIIENVRDELETMGVGTGYAVEEVPFAMAFLQGQAFMNRIALDLPELLLTLKQEDEDAERSD